jgi:protein-disulfide isomerase
MFSRRLLLVAAAAAGLALSGCNKGGAGAPSQDDMSMGPADAKVKVVEYASPSCTHCATFNNEVFPAFKAKYVDTGKVQYTLKEFLTAPEAFAAASFATARCAGKDKYFTVLDAVYRNQSQILQTGDLRGGLLAIAQSAGMTEEQFNKCVSDPDALKALNARVERNMKDGVTGTPTFFVNGKKIAEGSVTMEQLDAAIAEASK